MRLDIGQLVRRRLAATLRRHYVVISYRHASRFLYNSYRSEIAYNRDRRPACHADYFAAAPLLLMPPAYSHMLLLDEVI